MKFFTCIRQIKVFRYNKPADSERQKAADFGAISRAVIASSESYVAISKKIASLRSQ
jgi:hypothetical protein